MNYNLFIAIILGIVLIISLPVILFCIREHSQFSKSRKVTVGMPAEKMLKIMGREHERIFCRNKEIRYIWRLKGSAYTSSGITYYSGIRTVEIATKDNVVVSVKRYIS